MVWPHVLPSALLDCLKYETRHRAQPTNQHFCSLSLCPAHSSIGSVETWTACRVNPVERAIWCLWETRDWSGVCRSVFSVKSLSSIWKEYEQSRTLKDWAFYTTSRCYSTGTTEDMLTLTLCGVWFHFFFFYEIFHFIKFTTQGAVYRVIVIPAVFVVFRALFKSIIMEMVGFFDPFGQANSWSSFETASVNKVYVLERSPNGK